MRRYASETSVPVERTKAEIETLLIRYGAKQFHSGWDESRAMIGFKLKDLFIRFVLPFPPRDAARFKYKEVRGEKRKMTEIQSSNAWEQEVRSRWRALLLTVKAKLEAVEIGITTMENEFLAFIVLANSETLGDWISSNAMRQIRGGEMPKLLAGKTPDAPDGIQDAEIVKS